MPHQIKKLIVKNNVQFDYNHISLLFLLFLIQPLWTWLSKTLKIVNWYIHKANCRNASQSVKSIHSKAERWIMTVNEVHGHKKRQQYFLTSVMTIMYLKTTRRTTANKSDITRQGNKIAGQIIYFWHPEVSDMMGTRFVQTAQLHVLMTALKSSSTEFMCTGFKITAWGDRTQ